MDLSDDGGNSMSLSPADARNSLLLKGIFVLNACINLFGICLHSGLILVTIRNSKFHCTCNLLIATNSVCTLLGYQLVLIPLWLLLAPSRHFLCLLPCFLLQLVPLFATFHVFSLMLSIGFDRLLSAFWPIWYASRNDRRCLCLLFALSTIFPGCITLLAFSNVIGKPNAEKLCTLGDILGRQSRFVSLCCLYCIVLSVCCYLLVWIRLKKHQRYQQQHRDSNNSNIAIHTTTAQAPPTIFRSLCIILCLQVGGWVFGQLVYAAVYLNEKRISPLLRWQLNTLAMCFLSLAAAMDVLVLYWNSSDYRTAFRNQFPWLQKLLPARNEGKVSTAAVHLLSVQQQQNEHKR